MRLHKTGQTLKKAVIFDLDGTLYRTETSFYPAIRIFLNRYDLTVPVTSFLNGFIGEPGHVFVKWIESLSIDKPVKQLLHEFDDVELDFVKRNGELYDDVINVLKRLSQAGFGMGVCSNGSSKYINLIITKFDLAQYMEIVKYPLNSNSTKPVMLAEIKDALRPDIGYMVGDRYHDIQAADANGFISVGATYGYGKDDVRDADHTIDNFAQLLDIVL